MPKIPNIEKFRGNSDQSFSQWIKRYEAQCIALEISEDDNKKKWKNVLLVCTEGDAFDFVMEKITENNVTYHDLKDK